LFSLEVFEKTAHSARCPLHVTCLSGSMSKELGVGQTETASCLRESLKLCASRPLGQCVKSGYWLQGCRFPFKFMVYGVTQKEIKPLHLVTQMNGNKVTLAF
jgi:hypothetical protein